MSIERVTINPARLTEEQATSEFQRSGRGAIKVKIMHLDQCIYEVTVNGRKGMETGIWDRFKEKSDITIKLQQLDVFFTKNMFYQLVRYLTIGYLAIAKQQCLGVLYFAIQLGVDLGTNQGFICQTDLRTLWSVLLYVFNHQMSKYYPLMGKLIQANPQFLIDSRSKQLSPNILKFKKLNIFVQFLELLTTVLTMNRTECVFKQDKQLIQYLFKYYVSKNDLGRHQYSEDKLTQILGNRLSSDALDGKKGIDALINELTKKERQLKKLRNEKDIQIKEAERQMAQILQKLSSLQKIAQKQSSFDMPFQEEVHTEELLPQSRRQPPKEQRRSQISRTQRDKASVSRVQRTVRVPIVHLFGRRGCSCTEGCQMSCGHVCCEQCIMEQVLGYLYPLKDRNKFSDKHLGQIAKREAKCFECRTGQLNMKDQNSLGIKIHDVNSRKDS